MLNLNIQDLRIKAKIVFPEAPEGHVFTIREQTQGDLLKLSEINRKRSKLIVEANEIQKKSLKDKNLQADIDRVVKAIEDLETEQNKVEASIYDDGGDGTLSIALYNSLSAEERKTLAEKAKNGADSAN